MFNLIKNQLYFIFEQFLSLIYKENCCICGCSKDNKILCKTCSKSVEILSGFPQGKIRDIEIYSACIYKGNIRTLIHKLKFHHKLAVARVLGDILFKYYNKILDYKLNNSKSINGFQNAVIVPVPTSLKNKKERGYNNVFQIAKEFSKLSNIPVLENFLIKIKNTPPQFKISKENRKTNIKGVFKVNLTPKIKSQIKDKTIIIIDDIITTGATLEEIIKTLQENNINNIICITLSKAV